MLSPRVKSRLMVSRVSEINRRPLQTRLKRDEPDYNVNVEYLGHLVIAVTGRFTGKLYRFTPVQPMQQVDPRDAFYLLASRRFGVAP
jgi:hypothetical protein